MLFVIWNHGKKWIRKLKLWTEPQRKCHKTGHSASSLQSQQARVLGSSLLREKIDYTDITEKEHSQTLSPSLTADWLYLLLCNFDIWHFTKVIWHWQKFCKNSGASGIKKSKNVITCIKFKIWNSDFLPFKKAKFNTTPNKSQIKIGQAKNIVHYNFIACFWV